MTYRITVQEVRDCINRAIVRAQYQSDTFKVSELRERLTRAAEIAADRNREFEYYEIKDAASAHLNDW